MPIELGDNLRPLTPASFESIKNVEFVPERSLTGLKFFREKAGKERDLRELYRQRAPYELLQNADDAGAHVAVFALATDGLAFAHDGRWFNVGNFRSLADGWSDKDPNECIGHKGLGFRSVLDITPAPHLIQIDPSFFAIKFSWATNNNYIQRTLKHHKDFEAHYASWTRTGQRVCPVMAIPTFARKESLGGGLTLLNRFLSDRESSLTTMFWLPAYDSELPKSIAEDLSTAALVSGQAGQSSLITFLEQEVDVVLPFLSSIRTILILDSNAVVGKAELRIVSETGPERRIAVITDSRSRTWMREFFQMEFSCSIPQQVRNSPGTPKAVKYLKQADLKLAVRIKNEQPEADPDACFHVYFPTEQSTGFGFLVHGDFHVEPHRKYLVEGEYNKWLFTEAAKRAANEFLSSLLRNFRAAPVFGSLAPTDRDNRKDIFASQFATALTNRKSPFVPTLAGSAFPHEVVLAPSPAYSKSWEERFASVLATVCPGKKWFVANENDLPNSRAFLKFATVQVLERESLVSLVEEAGKQWKSAQWWYDCYEQLASDEKLARLERKFFVGRHLIPNSAGSVLAVPEDKGVLVCLHPDQEDGEKTVPDLFSDTFTFVDKGVSEVLKSGPDDISSWILNRFHISRFEGSDLIPRAIRTVAPKLFDGSLKATVASLIEGWQFVKALVEQSRTSFSDEFWTAVGRLPVCPSTSELSAAVPPHELIPCFAAYWPDELLQPTSSLAGVDRLKRIHPEFVRQLCGLEDSGSWLRFLSRAGVSDSPRLLRYARLPAGSEDIVVRGSDPATYGGFNGERQHDTNVLVADLVRRDPRWPLFSSSIAECGHAVQRVIQALSVVEGLSECSELAEREHKQGNDIWRGRLWNLASGLSLSLNELSSDAVYCRAGRQGGHTIPTTNYARGQVTTLRWLPSSAGPANSLECFLRRSTHKLISDTRSGENVNDLLLPSVVVDDLDVLLRLKNCGIRLLEDFTSDTTTLLSALREIGNRMCMDEYRHWIFEAAGRWRAVRGAIQEAYRTLNQRSDVTTNVRNIRFASRTSGGIKFQSLPLYYAEPGPVRDAFDGVVPLIDADRYFAALFDLIGVIQLSPGQSVVEIVQHKGEALPNPAMKGEIVEGLAPYLIAVLRAKSESQSDDERILRTLAERFEVVTVPELRVQFSLPRSPEIQPVSSPVLPFYLQRRLLDRGGAVTEAHYTLFVAAAHDARVADVDADALGTTVIQMFQDRPAADMTALFARVAVRYKDTNGATSAMRNFLYTHLGVSLEILETSEDESPPLDAEPQRTLESPPAAKVVGRAGVLQESSLQELFNTKQEEIKSRARDIADRVVQFRSDTQPTPDFATPLPNSGGAIDPITIEQRERGSAGEEEIKRRLCLPGGWEGFLFARDTRKERCGFDFEVQYGDDRVKLEVKTFTADGRVIVTSRELQAAAEHRSDYYLVGVLEDQSQPYSRWKTFLMRDPILSLMSLGQFVLDTTLQVNAAELFEFKSVEA